jgi:putative ABC transport system substrate-binding protein
MAFMHYQRKQPDSKNRAAVALLLIASLLTTLLWAGEVSGKSDIARVGILSFFDIDYPESHIWLEAFHRTIKDQGWIEGKTVSFDYRSAHSAPENYAATANALVELEVDVIVAIGAPALRAAYSATKTIPIVAIDFTSDPVSAGYAKSYAQPGGNVTGVFLDAPEFAGKWFELLMAMIPELARVSVLWDPAPGATHLSAVRGVAKSENIKLQVLEVRTPDDIDKAFDALPRRSHAVIILPSPMTYWQSPRLATLALEHRLPATSMAREFATAGGVLAYGPDLTLAWERLAVLVAKILSGSNPAKIPVERPTKFQLVVNLNTAKTLGITIPQSILLRADEVIR